MLDILYFPIWWYTVGLQKRARGFISGLRFMNHYFAFKILITHFFQPMFGQYDWRGRIISFLMRLIQLIIYSVIFLLGFIILLLVLILWTALPVVAIIEIIKLA